MKYVSLDIETTGLEKETCQIIQIAAVVDDLVSPLESLPKFTAFIDWKKLHFEPYALKMHIQSGLMLRHIEDKSKRDLLCTLTDLGTFLDAHLPLAPKEKRTVAGKNVAGFDLPFIRANVDKCTGAVFGGPTRTNMVQDTFSHRVIDPGTAFTDFFSDKNVVNLDDCKKRARVFDAPVSHDALDDAMDVVKVVREIAANNRGRFVEAPYVTNT